MTSQQLIRFYRMQPFRPFVIHMGDGRSLRVDHPEMISYVEGARTAAVWLPREEAHEIVDLLLVTSLEPVSKRRNGRRPPSRHRSH